MSKILLFALIFLNLTFLNNASATVGGGLIISDIYYYPENNKIYYIKNSFGGDGGKYIMSYSLNTGKSKEIFNTLDCSDNCSDFNDLTYKKIIEKTEKVKGDSIPLREIKLNSLDITFEARLVDGRGFWSKNGKVQQETSETIDIGKQFKWEITPYYNGKVKKPGYAFSCFIPFFEANNKDLDINFRGYAYPGGSFIFIVISTIDWSLEFGYVGEEAFCIKDVVLPKEIFLDKYSSISSQEINDRQVASTEGSVFQTLDTKQIGKYLRKIGLQACREGDYSTGNLYFKVANYYLENIKKPSISSMPGN